MIPRSQTPNVTHYFALALLAQKIARRCDFEHERLSVSTHQPCDWLATCPGSTPPLTQCQLGSVPAAHHLLKDKQVYVKDGRMNYWHMELIL